MRRHLILVALMTLLLVGCGDPDDPPSEPPDYFSEIGAP